MKWSQKISQQEATHEWMAEVNRDLKSIKETIGILRGGLSNLALSSNQEIDRLDKYLRSEEFLSSIIDRIKKMQLK